jgi:hypothetical protein
MRLETRPDTVPCPYCGAEPEVRMGDEYCAGRYQIKCTNKDCPAWLVVVYGKTEDEAYAKWNTRIHTNQDDDKTFRIDHKLHALRAIIAGVRRNANDAYDYTETIERMLLSETGEDINEPK